MKYHNRAYHALLWALLLSLILMTMVACGGEHTETPTETDRESVTETETDAQTPASDKITYTVTVTDGMGAPIESNVIVKIKKDGTDVSMKPYNGQSVSFELTPDTYQVELDLMGANLEYNQEACVLDKDHPSLTVQLFSALSDRTTSLFFNYPLEKDYNAYFISEGSTRVPLTPEDYTFFVFTPAHSAIYHVEYACDSELAVSYHGSTFFAQGMDLSEDNSDMTRLEKGLAISVYQGNIGSTYIIGVKSETATECILNIKNAGKPGTHVSEMPWTPYTEDPAKVQEHLDFSAEGTYTTVDVTDSTLKAVFNDADGYYHLGTADGPVLFIDLTSGNRFIASITEICRKQGMGVYLYDDDGNVTEKRSYTELFIQYGLVIDETQSAGNIKVPLTAKLAEAIQVFGGKMNWWTPDSAQNIFYNGEYALLPGETLNVEFAWLLFCGYYA